VRLRLSAEQYKCLRSAKILVRVLLNSWRYYRLVTKINNSWRHNRQRKLKLLQKENLHRHSWVGLGWVGVAM